jgi:hypothetical protein
MISGNEPQEYPEHEKMMALKGQNNVVGRFLDWLDGENIGLAKWGPDGINMQPHYESKESIISRHFGIDLNKLEAEKRMMLEALRG